MNIIWLFSFFPKGWLFDRESNLYKLIGVVAEQFDDLFTWIEYQKWVIPEVAPEKKDQSEDEETSNEVTPEEDQSEDEETSNEVTPEEDQSEDEETSNNNTPPWIIPAAAKGAISRWERMMGINYIEEDSQRIINIRNKLVGEYGLFNSALIKKIIQFYTSEIIDDNVDDDEIFTMENDSAFRVGKGMAGERLSDAGSVFTVYLNIAKEIPEENQKLLVEEINRVKHAHLTIVIKFQGEPYA